MREAKYKMFYAAGNYWIMSCDSSDEQYMTPIIINETGAVIWKYLSECNCTEVIRLLWDNNRRR